MMGAVRWWRGLSARRRLLVVAVAAIATVVVLAAVVVAVGDGAGRPERAAQERPGPVLLVPGYGGGRESLLVLAARIRAAGRAAQVLTLPGDGTGDLVAQARVLSEAAAGAVSAGAPSVDVVGYSAGGVVARVAVADAATARRVRRVVTLGAPLQGARIAAAGGVLAPGACPVACQQLTPGSALLRELAGRPLPGQLPWLSIWTEDDRTVMPPDSARLAGAVNVSLQELCAGTRVQHGELPTDPLAVGLVLRALGTDPPRAPDPAECAAIRAEGFSS
jgi:triacylglycerol lipase